MSQAPGSFKKSRILAINVDRKGGGTDTSTDFVGHPRREIIGFKDLLFKVSSNRVIGLLDINFNGYIRSILMMVVLMNEFIT